MSPNINAESKIDIFASDSLIKLPFIYIFLSLLIIFPIFENLYSKLFDDVINNPKYIALTYKIAIKSKKYSSIIYRLKYSILYYRYSFHNNNAKLLKFYHLPYFVIGYIIKFIDKTRLFIQSNKFNL